MKIRLYINKYLIGLKILHSQALAYRLNAVNIPEKPEADLIQINIVSLSTLNVWPFDAFSILDSVSP